MRRARSVPAVGGAGAVGKVSGGKPSYGAASVAPKRMGRGKFLLAGLKGRKRGGKP